MFQLDRSQFPPKIFILNPSGYWTIGHAFTFMKDVASAFSLMFLPKTLILDKMGFLPLTCRAGGKSSKEDIPNMFIYDLSLLIVKIFKEVITRNIDNYEFANVHGEGS